MVWLQGDESSGIVLRAAAAAQVAAAGCSGEDQADIAIEAAKAVLETAAAAENGEPSAAVVQNGVAVAAAVVIALQPGAPFQNACAVFSVLQSQLAAARLQICSTVTMRLTAKVASASFGCVVIQPIWGSLGGVGTQLMWCSSWDSMQCNAGVGVVPESGSPLESLRALLSAALRAQSNWAAEVVMAAVASTILKWPAGRNTCLISCSF